MSKHPTQFASLPPPVIIIGMHRSGTSLVAGVLHLLGVYVDPALSSPGDASLLNRLGEKMRQSGYGEAVCFRLINEQIMAQASAEWNHVRPFLEVRDTPRFRKRALRTLTRAVQTTLPITYFAPLQEGFHGLWGWKDPRNSMTLPYWLEIFPQAYVIHVRRNAEDVAKSLIQRARRTEATAPLSKEPLSNKLLRHLKHPHQTLGSIQRRLRPTTLSSSLPRSPLSREDCFLLSQEYVEECLKYRALGSHYLEISYEEISDNPAESIQKLAEFLALFPNPTQKRNAIQFVRPHKTEEHLNSPPSREETLFVHA